MAKKYSCYCDVIFVVRVVLQAERTTSIMKSTKVQNPRYNKCSAVVEKNCLVAEYRVAYRISGPRTIIIIVANYYRHVHR